MIGRNPNTFIVGAGRLATALAGGLRLAGVPVLGLWARRPAQARAAAGKAGVAAFSSAPPDLLLEAKVGVVAVSDAAIGEVAQMLVGTGLVGKTHILVHASGALSAREAFAPVASKVGGVATMHPLRAIADGGEAQKQLRGCVFGVEGDADGVRAVTDLVGALGGQRLALGGEAMAAYHTAAATASNYLVALIDAATQILGGAGIEGSEAQAALVALMRGTLDNVAARGPAAALTGPIRRGEVETIARHLRVLDGSPAVVADAYRAMGRLTVELARGSDGANQAALDAIAELLSEGGAARSVKALP